MPHKTVKLGQPLTAQELHTLTLVAEGLSYVEAGNRLFLSPHTIHSHLRNIRTKLGASNTRHAVTLALKARLIGGGS